MRMNLKDTSFLGLPASPPLFSPLLSVQDTSSSYQVSSSPVLCSPRPLSLSLSLSGRAGARGASSGRCCLRPKEGNLSTGDKTRSDLRDSELGGREEKAQLERSSHPLTTMALYQTTMKVENYTHVAEL